MQRRIMTHLKEKGHVVEHQILNNKASKDYHHAITNDWKATYQLVSLDVHHAITSKRAIQTFKAHFLSILAGIDNSFPNYLWDKLLPQTELTVKLLCQATIALTTSAWEYFHDPFNYYDSTSLSPTGCLVIICTKATTHNSWDFLGCSGSRLQH